jgi:hypothetical protein
VTAYDADTGHPPAPDTDVLVKAAEDHPDQIKLLDWVKYSLPHHKVEPAPGAWFLPDLFHPNFTGAHAYGNFLAQVLPGGGNDVATASASGKESDSGGGTPWWPFVVGAAALVLAALFLVRRRVKS